MAPPATAVQQATASVAATVEHSTVHPAPSPGRRAARVTETRAAVADSAAAPAGAVASSRIGGSAAEAQIVAAARPTAPVASGWRNASATSGHRANGGFASPQQRGLASAAASPAGAAATALLGLLALVILTSHGFGTRIRLGPTWAPAAPFLALSERPG